MKILHTVESYLPARHGMSEVVRQLSERLAAKGHEVTVATSTHPQRGQDLVAGVRVVSFPVAGKSATGVYGDVQGYQRFLLESDADIIVNFAAQQWATDLIFSLLPSIRAKKVFVPTGFSALGDPAFATYFEKMRKWMHLYDACVFLSDNYRDINFAREAGVEKCALLPNAAARDEFQQPGDPKFRKSLGIPESDGLIIHVAGYLSLAKGQIEAVRIFSGSNIRNATLLLICGQFAEGLFSDFKPRNLAKAVWHFLRGRGTSGFMPAWQIGLRARLAKRRNESHGRRVITKALSREETVQAFKSADLLLFPSWIECSPLVLFEAAAAGTPFLVTDVGNSQEIIRWTGGGRILPGTRRADREGSMVAEVPAGARLLDEVWSDHDARNRMGNSAQAAWRRHFTWEHLADRYEQLYLALLNNEDIRGQFKAPPETLTQ